MDVRGVGPATGGNELPGGLHTRPAVSPEQTFAESRLSPDSVARLLTEITTAEIARLMEIVDRPLSPADTARARLQVAAAGAAARAGDTAHVAEHAAAALRLDPRLAETILDEPALAHVRAEVERALGRMTSTARADAEEQLEAAENVVVRANALGVTLEQVRPESVVLFAARLDESGGYVNLVRSAALSRVLIERYQAVAAGRAPELSVSEEEEAAAARITELWRRAPLLVLMLGWLAAGLAAGFVIVLGRWTGAVWPAGAIESGVELWAVGFLALVGFGFYARVRGGRK